MEQIEFTMSEIKQVNDAYKKYGELLDKFIDFMYQFEGDYEICLYNRWYYILSERLAKSYRMKLCVNPLIEEEPILKVLFRMFYYYYKNNVSKQIPEKLTYDNFKGMFIWLIDYNGITMRYFLNLIRSQLY